MAAARKTSYFALVFVFVLMISAQLLSAVNCRPLRESPRNTVAASKDQGQERGGAEIVKRAQSSVNNMAFIMVSGPSRKGPGH
ncbi:hypothetical protein RND71_027668 [Anisodus tanguticus]|uniref:Uncharacterized protein n=1 Tax=Anisodus tanguticus TaxID=243964 RepID=A0AAE1V995_9SOLA|nr:hypothetical protein RND71_027668 [Anisodus tanguticus]